MYPDQRSKDAQKPKALDLSPHQAVHATGFYIFQHESSAAKTNIYLFLVIVGLVFFLLYRVWPDWLKVYAYYASWYTLEFLIGAAIIRVIVWFFIFHIGIDFWIFPNYWCDSNNPLDALWPLLSVERRKDMFDPTMLIVRLASGFLIFYTGAEFMKDP